MSHHIVTKCVSVLIIALCVLIISSCGNGPGEIVFDNPLDPDYKGTSGQAHESSSITLTQLTTNPGTDWMPHWSPDGTTIVYVASPDVISHPEDSSQDIWVIPAAGGTPTKLTTFNEVDGYGPRYSPDGSRILYSTTMNSLGLGIWSIPSGGGIPTKVYDTTANDFGASWSPDGNQIAFRSETPNQTLWIVSSDGSGSGLQQLTFTGDYSAPDWSPDGSVIMFHSLATSAGLSDLWTIPATGGTLTRFTNTPGWDEIQPAYSPDGQWVAFASDRGGNWGIWVMSVVGGEQDLIVEGYVSNPVWSPDGTMIAFDMASSDTDLYSKDVWIASDLPHP